MPSPLFTARITTFLLDILFPKQCIVCSKEGAYVCEECAGALEPLPFLSCPICSKKIPDGRICANCRKNSGVILLRFFAALPYKNPFVRALVQQAKYKPSYARELLEEGSRLLIRFLAHHKFPNIVTEVRKKQNILLIPVPLHKSKLRLRAFNQAEVIASLIAAEFSIPIANDILMRIRPTEPQTSVHPLERKTNIEGAFGIKNSGAIKNSIVILVDDVYTSGSTMNECAKVLKNAGAKQVWGIALAK